MGQLQERYKNYREPQKYMAAGVYPYFREITSKQMTEVTDIDGHKILMFGSNAYQGLTNDQRVIDAAKAALDKYGSGCAGSRFLNGTLDLHVQLEKGLAEFMHKDGTRCFSTGLSVNQGVLAWVVGRNAYISAAYHTSQHALVDRETCREAQGRILVHELGQLLLELYVKVEGSIEETASCTTRTILVERSLGCIDNTLVVGQTLISIGTEH